MKILPLLAAFAATASAFAADAGYLFVTFKGEESPMTEQIYFAVSDDGKRWDGLYGNEPVLVSKLGEKGVRDPFIFRSHDGSKTYIIATDLSIHLNRDWGRAQRSASKSIRKARMDCRCCWECASTSGVTTPMPWKARMPSDQILKSSRASGGAPSISAMTIAGKG